MLQNCRTFIGPPNPDSGFTNGNNNANRDLILRLLNKYYSKNQTSFCKGLNPDYVSDSIQQQHGKMNCIFITANVINKGVTEERLHSFATFDFKNNDTIANLDTVCAADNTYVFANGAWRLFKILYGLFNKIERLTAIYLDSVNNLKTLGFYNDQDFEKTGRLNGQLIEHKKLLHGKTFKDIVHKTMQPKLVKLVRRLQNTGVDVVKPQIDKQFEIETLTLDNKPVVVSYPLKESVVIYFKFNDTEKYGDATYKLFNINDDDSYDIMSKDGTIIYGVTEEMVTEIDSTETIIDSNINAIQIIKGILSDDSIRDNDVGYHVELIGDEKGVPDIPLEEGDVFGFINRPSDKQKWREKQVSENFKHRPTGKHLVIDPATKRLMDKLRKKRGGSRKPRKTKKRRRNSKKNKKNI
jgi:hypothetical protein